LLEGRKVIEAADVEKVVGSSRQFTVFELRDALGERNAVKAVRTLNRLLEVGEKPVGIVASLFTHFASLAKAKELDRQSPKEMLAAALKVNPYFVEKIFYQANRYSTEQLDQVFSLLLEADQQLKSSAQKPELILQLLVMEIVTLGRKNE
ncbi:MAG: DNA polymerase III subunit delta, partial [candidate division KSB1 bacterium]|nr:DNA polymerase III subunit delta [candidate division KSB1 bacterium]